MLEAGASFEQAFQAAKPEARSRFLGDVASVSVAAQADEQNPLEEAAGSPEAADGDDGEDATPAEPQQSRSGARLSRFSSLDGVQSRFRTIGSKMKAFNIKKAVTQFNGTSENPTTLDTPQNIHQATIYYCMQPEGTGCSKCLWFTASILIILMQVVAALAVFFGVFAPSCSENGDCPIDGQFCPNGELSLER